MPEVGHKSVAHLPIDLVRHFFPHEDCRLALFQGLQPPDERYAKIVHQQVGKHLGSNPYLDPFEKRPQKENPKICQHLWRELRRMHTLPKNLAPKPPYARAHQRVTHMTMNRPPLLQIIIVCKGELQRDTKQEGDSEKSFHPSHGWKA